LNLGLIASMAQGHPLLICAFIAVIFFAHEALAFHCFCPDGDSPVRSQLNATNQHDAAELQIAADYLDSEVGASNVDESSDMCDASWKPAGSLILPLNVSREEQLLKRRLREQQKRDSETSEEREARRKKRRERDDRRRPEPVTAEEREARRQMRRERDQRRRLRDPEQHQERLAASRECEEEFRQQHPEEHQEILAARRLGT